MATAANPYEGGGAGGKFRKHPPRRSAAAATPYDRPPEAARGGGGRRPLAHHLGGGGGSNGWLSKLVDPASRIITNSATRLFSSVFRKRLPAPPPPSQEAKAVPAADAAPEVDLGSGNGTSEVAHMDSSLEQFEHEGVGGVKHNNNFDGSGISELELLLKKKTFTRVEFDRLTELLRSRTVDLSADNEKKMTQPGTPQPAVIERHQNANVSSLENGVKGNGLLGTISTPKSQSQVSKEDIASPTEIARAYMGLVPSKLSSSALVLRSPAHRDNATQLNNATLPTKSNFSLAPRSAVRFSGVPGIPGSAPRPHRSAIYNMSRSPYSRVHPASTFKSPGPSVDGYASPSTSSQWSPVDVAPSSGKQVLKRRSSALDDDFFGTIRRTRQKSNLLSSSKDARLVSGNLHGTPVAEGSLQLYGSTSMVQKPGPKYDKSNIQDEKGRDGTIPGAGFGAVPAQSSEMAMKIFRQLDKLAPSPKDKSPEMKVAARDKSSLKLSYSMLNGGALRSMENLDTSDLSDVQNGGTVEGPSTSQLSSPGGLILGRHDRIEENGPTNGATPGSKLSSEVKGMEKKFNIVKDTVSEATAVDFVFPASAAFPLAKTRAFQMSAPEGSLEWDDDDDSSKVVFPSSAVEEKLESSAIKCSAVLGKSLSTEKPAFLFSESKPSTSPPLNKDTDTRIPVEPVSFGKKDTGFTFPVVPSTSCLSQPPTPTMSNPSSDVSVVPREKTAPAVSFDSKDVPAFSFSSTTTSFSGSTGLKFGEGLDAKQEKFGSNASLGSKPMPEPPTETSISDKSGETQKDKESPKSAVDGNPSGFSVTPTVFSFGGASTGSSLSNGSLSSTPPTISVTTAPAVPSYSSSASPFLFSSTKATFIGSTPSTSSASLAPIFSAAPKVSETVTKFQFGSSASATGIPSDSVSSSLATVDANNSVSNVKKPSPFGIVPSDSVAPSSATVDASNSELNIKKSSPFGINGPSVPATTPAFASTGGGIFSFGASTSSSTSSLPSTDVKPSPSPFGSTASGSMFDTQSARSGLGASIFTQSTTSQFGASVSSPIFGTSASSSFGVSSPFSSFPPQSSAAGAEPVSSSSLFGSSSLAVFSSGAASSFSGGSSLFAAPATTPSLFGSGSQPSQSTPFGSSFGSTSSSPSPAFSFASSPVPSSNTPVFGSSTGFSFTSGTTASSSSGFSFTSSTNTSSSSGFPFTSSTINSTPPQPMFGMPTQATGFVPGSPGNNDQMSVEDSVADDSSLKPSSAMPMIPAFGQTPPPPNMMFGSPAIPTGGGNMQNQSPFLPQGGMEFTTGSFSLGSSGPADKSKRKMIRVNRDKHRKK
ncbi:hypothetical protein QJS04_geneDACA012940 [Acorus gramineus]|uniref:Nuclear pore complex protein NUP1 n=1 Tax=Acorus gramineus TaxID=55184 RepID=A0AAV9B0G6_ACOGR|nr:hypothetical protein QJS04_geneDACA012940 [Acorus gramineus]